MTTPVSQLCGLACAVDVKAIGKEELFTIEVGSSAKLASGTSCLIGFSRHRSRQIEGDNGPGFYHDQKPPLEEAQKP